MFGKWNRKIDSFVIILLKVMGENRDKIKLASGPYINCKSYIDIVQQTGPTGEFE